MHTHTHIPSFPQYQMLQFFSHTFSLRVMLTENSLLEEDNTFHLVRPADEIDEGKSKRGSMKDKAMTKAITEIYLTRLLSVKVRRLPESNRGRLFLQGRGLIKLGDV